MLLKDWGTQLRMRQVPDRRQRVYWRCRRGEGFLSTTRQMA